MPSPTRTQGLCNQRATRWTIWMVQSSVVLWRVPARVCTRWEGASTVNKGQAQGRWLQGKGTNSIMGTHCSPKQVTTGVAVDRTASR